MARPGIVLRGFIWGAGTSGDGWSRWPAGTRRAGRRLVVADAEAGVLADHALARDEDPQRRALAQRCCGNFVKRTLRLPFGTFLVSVFCLGQPLPEHLMLHGRPARRSRR